MEMKKWKEYTTEEKTALLNHWWYYFGKMVILREEQDEWEKISRDTPDLAWDMAVMSFTHRLTSQPIILAMRQGCLEQYKAVTRRVAAELRGLASDIWYSTEARLLLNVISTYNAPEPPVPFSDEQKIQQIEQLSGIKNPTLLTVDLDEINRQMKNL